MQPNYHDFLAGVDATVVGIDLTGSGARPSGWCVLRGEVARTERLRSDGELIERTLAESPQVVSLDSPLSLPTGRISIDDTDPGRAVYGIMRQCERMLRRRGMGVYPCLIPSMQKLTQRGIALASAFRTHGLPVIEGYPGGAQDVLGIPRKRAKARTCTHRLSDEMQDEAAHGCDIGTRPARAPIGDGLKAGLIRFGIRGAFETAKVSHDELDAITAALIGVFYVTGQFEAIGDPEEGLLILPSNGSGATTANTSDGV